MNNIRKENNGNENHKSQIVVADYMTQQKHKYVDDLMDNCYKYSNTWGIHP